MPHTVLANNIYFLELTASAGGTVDYYGGMVYTVQFGN
jgi:hypothetical protein